MNIQNQEKIIVIDFGGQYNQLVARRVRENNVYCEIYSYRTPLEKIREMQPKGIILTGGPASCYEEGAASCDPDLFRLFEETERPAEHMEKIVTIEQKNY